MSTCTKEDNADEAKLLPRTTDVELVAETSLNCYVFPESDDSGFTSFGAEPSSGSPSTISSQKTDSDATNDLVNDNICDANIEYGKNVDDIDNELPAIEDLCIYSDAETLPNFEGLVLDSDCESLDNKIKSLSLDPSLETLAGIVTSVAGTIGLMIVQPPKLSAFILDIGSPLFLTNHRKTIQPDDAAFGIIEDIFGTADDPYYCVKPASSNLGLVREGCQLFYSTDHPRTTFISLRRDEKNRYTLLYSKKCPLLEQNSEVSSVDGDFYSDYAEDFHNYEPSRGKNRASSRYRARYGNGTENRTYGKRITCSTKSKEKWMNQSTFSVESNPMTMGVERAPQHVYFTE